MGSQTRLRVIGFGLLVVFAARLAGAQSNQEWLALKARCGLSSTLAYNDWVASGSPCNTNATTTAPASPAGLNPVLGNAVQTFGYTLGQQLGKALFGGGDDSANDAAQQQRDLAAQQLNNSGIYLLKQKNYSGAINEFQQALAKTPNDATILSNLALAKEQLKNAAAAAKTSSALTPFLGRVPANPETLDFDPRTHSSVTNPNASALNLVHLGSDASVVDLSGVTRTSPESLKNQIDGLLTRHDLSSAKTDSQVVLPQAKDIELLFQPPQASPSQWPGPHRPTGESKLVNPLDEEQETKARVEAIFGKPAAAVPQH